MDRDRYVSICMTPDGDLSDHMARRGWAVAYTQYSMRYVGAELEARQAKRALWRSEFERPHVYRARLRQEAANRPQQAAPDPDCKIKGNISRSGERIFHMPGQADYSRTRINIQNGERWFCSRDEASAAGWRIASR